MSKKNSTRLGLELVAYAGEARSYLLEALDYARNKKFDNISNLLNEAEQLIVQAHRTQADMLFEEAKGNFNEVTITMVHGQDHLMTTILLKELVINLIELWREK